MESLYRCDQCGHDEWRPTGQEPWLCLVCGGMRWEEVARRETPPGAAEPSEATEAGATAESTGSAEGPATPPPDAADQ